MIELPLILVSGVLGSSHCIGMCGPFTLALAASTRSFRENVWRQLVYSLGRVFTYTVMGTVAGTAGLKLATSVPAIFNVPAVLALAAGSFLIYQGLAAAGVWRRPGIAGSSPCLGGTMLATFLSATSSRDVFLAGLLTGFLPCGLVYAFLAVAAGSGSPFLGGGVMIAFGLGTVPVMVATGCGGQLLSVAARSRLLQAAAWCVVAAGGVSIARGVAYLAADPASQVPACPFCL